MSVSSPGPLCEELGLYGEMLLLDSIELNNPVDQGKITKGVILELSQFRKSHNVSWNVFDAWMKSICPGSSLPQLPALKSYIGRIETKIKQLKRNHCEEEIKSVMKEPFLKECQQPNTRTLTVDREKDSSTAKQYWPCETEVLKSVNKSLAYELAAAQNALTLQEAKANDLTAKLSKLSIRNTNKKLKRRDEKILDLKELVKESEKSKEGLNKATARVKSYQYKLSVSKSKCDTISERCDHLESVVQGLNKDVISLKQSLQHSENNYDRLFERLQELESHVFETKEHQKKYLDSVRACCIELLSLNVGIKNVEPVIRSVLKHIASFEIKELAHLTTLTRMFSEMKGLACQQLSEELQKGDNLTLHSDGTSKYGQHFYSFQLSTPDTTYSLGLTEMSSGSATHVLSTFQQILYDLELITQSGSSHVILSKIKNTMSDRHIIEKNFNSLLQSYRLEVLPSVVDNWAELGEDEQQGISTLNNFFCGLHLLVGMADVASSTLLQWELTHFEGTVGAAGLFSSATRQSESGIVRLIRTACKALCKHGSEQSGVYQPFTTFLATNGIKKNPLVSFRRNRFNIVFYDSGALYYISDQVVKFFNEVWQTPNQLLKAVRSDITVPELVAGCRALDLINKIITGPLWRVLESDNVTILEMNTYFDVLITKLDEWAQDASRLLQGDAELYADYPPIKDEIWYRLIASTDHDATAQELLEILCKAFSALLSRLVQDHLPGGAHCSPSVELINETKSVSKTNVVSERDFGKLDRLLREKPNATTLSLEAMILFSNNKTMNWLTSKSPEEVQHLLQAARKVAPEFRRLFKQRKQIILDARIRALHEKQHALEAARIKQLRRKENLTKDIIQYGLWQSKEDIAEGVAKERSKAAKLRALKTQLNFRKQVLDQRSYRHKELFLFSKGGRQYIVKELMDNLAKLINEEEEAVSGLADEGRESLVGKTIKHRWRDESGVEQWYLGNVLSKVAGTNEWYNVRYEGEDDVLTLNLHEDIDSGDLEVVL